MENVTMKCTMIILRSDQAVQGNATHYNTYGRANTGRSTGRTPRRALNSENRWDGETDQLTR
jgi:hypothetical protein